MKLKQTLLTISVLLAMGIAASNAGELFTKCKAERNSGKQNAANSKAKSEEAIPGADVKPAAYFYTGKPYDEDLGGYIFSCRTYSPGMSRWTTPDPSGFPDGMNNQRYSPIPTNALDPMGLEIQHISSVSASSFWPCYQSYDYAAMPGPDDVYNRVGGELNTLHTNEIKQHGREWASQHGDYYESCALRLDMAFVDLGYTIHSNDPGALPFTGGNYGSYYILSAASMSTYAGSILGASDRTIGAGTSGV